MKQGGVAKVALVLGVVFSAVVLALWSGWDAAAITGFVGGISGVAVALWIQLNATREVHVMINQQRTDAKNFTNLLEDTLRGAGVAVPRDESLQ